MKPRTEKYLRSYAASPKRPLVASSLDGIEKAVIIPALAEHSSLFRTLASLATNPSDELHHTLVVCVVNNHRPNIATSAEINDNQETLHLLNGLVAGKVPFSCCQSEMREDLERIAGSALRLGIVDASSPGSEISDDDGGVGTARKIGMDAVLGVIDRSETQRGVICCLDADTLVEENYLSAMGAHFQGNDMPAAVSGYAHQKPADQELLAAICCYELFLRSYVIGLSYARSPYAFHAIGSTMACTVDGYVGVRGMNRRNAAEDFYFLNKLAKIGKIGVVTETTVFPSPRVSGRVPFGTGRQMLKHMTGRAEEYRLYDPRIFTIIRKWLAGIEADPDRDPTLILAEAEAVHPHLAGYLRMSRLEVDWQNIRWHSRDQHHLLRQFHVWFDGFKTLKLVRHLSRTAFPPVPLFDGLAGLLDLIGVPFPLDGYSRGVPEPAVQCRVLETVRSCFPLS
ncbi:MAG: glycosyltransferase family 2 protein [Syntrophales bacterium]